ncbi:MAG: (Fe-S)-binding protein [Gammaproteobacteria bacterium]
MTLKAGLFATCLADIFRPQLAAAAAQLIREAGATPFYPPRQTCCGQIAFNGGNFADAAILAEKCADLFVGCDKVVFPSASCCGLFRVHWREMCGEDNKKMRDFADKCVELSEFLLQMNYIPPLRRDLSVRATYHDCCAGLRELGIKQGPRSLLARAGVEIVEMRDCEECCGFGGAFSVKFGALSVALADRKCENIAAAADTVLLGDLGCILHLEGRLRRLGKNIRLRHWAEVLADSENRAP